MSEVLRLLSISKKAGKTELGETPVLAAVGSRKARLVLLTSDASDNTIRRIGSAVGRTHITSMVIPYNKEELGAAFGRTSLAVCAICDVGLSVAISSALEALSPEDYASQAGEVREMADRIAQRKLKKPGSRAGRKEKHRTE